MVRHIKVLTHCHWQTRFYNYESTGGKYKPSTSWSFSVGSDVVRKMVNIVPFRSTLEVVSSSICIVSEKQNGKRSNRYAPKEQTKVRLQKF